MLRRDRYQRPIGVLFDTGNGRRLAGQLKLKRDDLLDCNVVNIADDKFFHVADGGSLHGISKAGKVSLLDCVQGRMLGATNWGDFTIHHGDASFRYALFGKQHVSNDEKCVGGIQFTLEGAQSSVFMNDEFERFGHLPDPDEAILNAIEQKRPEYMKGEFVKGKAMVSYFTGDWEFLPRFETVLGTVHVGRSIQSDFVGRHMTDTPRITVNFEDDPSTVEDAWQKMRVIRQFFAWMMGYAPGWKDVLLLISPSDEEGFRADADGELEAFGPNEWREVSKRARQCGTLIDGSQHPDHFVEVMAKWMERHGNARRSSANERYFGSMQGMADRAIEDGIVSAANTFDLLPSEDKPAADRLPKRVRDVLTDARVKIKCYMPHEPQRDDVLSSLGLIQRNRRLRHIVEYRAEIVRNHFGPDRLTQLDKVIGLAVKCRNHYTHGPGEQSPGDVDYADFQVVRFLTATLEFIYGASELLLCGWDPRKSVRDECHPLGGYVKFYDAKRSSVLGMPSHCTNETLPLT